jgi:hypothetical protein
VRLRPKKKLAARLRDALAGQVGTGHAGPNKYRSRTYDLVQRNPPGGSSFLPAGRSCADRRFFSLFSVILSRCLLMVESDVAMGTVKLFNATKGY